MVFVTVQNLVGIGAVVSMLYASTNIFCTLGLKVLIHALNRGFGDLTPKWGAV